MSRGAIFDAIREARGKGFSDGEVQQIDAVLDGLGVPRDGPDKPVAPPPPQPQKPSTAIPDDYWPMLSRIESGNRPYIKAGSSSASGLYQFIKSTWIGEGGRWGGDMSKAFGGLTPSAEEQIQRAKTFTEKNADYLRRAGIPINKASLYAAHFFGAGTAAKVIGADVDARADHIAGKAATDANPSILRGKTVGQFLTWLNKKTGDWAR
jgi:hypothetical protein